jgi:hypothetical protein
MVEEFQNQAFDQRLWEIYLWAAFRDFGLDITQLEAPDFECRAPGIDFTVEATTVAPSMIGPLVEHSIASAFHFPLSLSIDDGAARKPRAVTTS